MSLYNNNNKEEKIFFLPDFFSDLLTKSQLVFDMLLLRERQSCTSFLTMQHGKARICVIIP